MRKHLQVLAPSRPPACRRRLIWTCAGACLLWSLSSAATDLVYQPINPSFGGNPFNSSHLLGLAERQNDHKDNSHPSFNDSPADQFVRQLQSRMLSSLASQVNDAIFGENAAESGRIVFGDQIITFERGLEGVHLVIQDLAGGSQTEITVPLLQVH